MLNGPCSLGRFFGPAVKLDVFDSLAVFATCDFFCIENLSDLASVPKATAWAG